MTSWPYIALQRTESGWELYVRTGTAKGEHHRRIIGPSEMEPHKALSEAGARLRLLVRPTGGPR